jgi:hypothetical protein
VLVSLNTSSTVRIALPHPLCLPFVYTSVSYLFAIVVFGLPRTYRIRPYVVGFHARLHTGKLLLGSLGPCACARTQLTQSFSYENLSITNVFAITLPEYAILLIKDITMGLI